MPVALKYSTPAAATGEFDIDTSPGSVTLRYPLLPNWVRVGSVAFNFAAAAGATVAFVWVMWRFVGLYRWAQAPVPWMNPGSLSYAGGLILWWLVAVYSWLDYRRWRGWSRSLYADAEKLVWSTRGVWRPHQRSWPASSVIDVSCRRLWSLPGTKRASLVTVRFRNAGPLKLRIASVNPDLPERFARELTRVVRHKAHDVQAGGFADCE